MKRCKLVLLRKQPCVLIFELHCTHVSSLNIELTEIRGKMFIPYTFYGCPNLELLNFNHCHLHFDLQKHSNDLQIMATPLQ
jgi:hypothetical protein